MVTNTVSVDYLTKPLQVFQEVGRVLRPGRLDNEPTDGIHPRFDCWRFGCETIYCFSIPGEGLDKCSQMKRGRIFLLQKKHGSRFSSLSGATDSDKKMVTLGLVLYGLFRSRQKTTFLDA